MQHIIQQKTPVFLRALRHRCLRRGRLKVRGRCLFWSGGCFHRLCHLFGCPFGSACLQSRLFCAAVLYLCACIGTGSGKKYNDRRQNNQLFSLIPFSHISSFHQEKTSFPVRKYSHHAASIYCKTLSARSEESIRFWVYTQRFTVAPSWHTRFPLLYIIQRPQTFHPAAVKRGDLTEFYRKTGGENEHSLFVGRLGTY